MSELATDFISSSSSKRSDNGADREKPHFSSCEHATSAPSKRQTSSPRSLSVHRDARRRQTASLAYKHSSAAQRRTTSPSLHRCILETQHSAAPTLTMSCRKENNKTKNNNAEWPEPSSHRRLVDGDTSQTNTPLRRHAAVSLDHCRNILQQIR